MLIDPRVQIAEFLEARGHRGQREIRRVAVSNFVPCERCRDARVWGWPHRIRRGDGAILGVLVVVDEHPVALLLPPLAGGERRRTFLDFTRERERSTPHFIEAP